MEARPRAVRATAGGRFSTGLSQRSMNRWTAAAEGAAKSASPMALNTTSYGGKAPNCSSRACSMYQISRV